MFYEFLSGEEYAGNLDDVFEEEYLTLLGQKDTLIRNATFTAPERVLAGEDDSESEEDGLSEYSQDAYRIYVVDKDKHPISGVTIQFYTDKICKMAVTGENGMISFDDPEAFYDVHVLKVPEGYKPDSNLYHTEDSYGDLTIILEKD